MDAFVMNSFLMLLRSLSSELPERTFECWVCCLDAPSPAREPNLSFYGPEAYTTLQPSPASEGLSMRPFFLMHFWTW